MDDKELFEEVLKSFCERYKLTVAHPYRDGYIELANSNGEVVCQMNPDGRNLLANLRTLTEQLSYELE